MCLVLLLLLLLLLLFLLFSKRMLYNATCCLAAIKASGTFYVLVMSMMKIEKRNQFVLYALVYIHICILLLDLHCFQLKGVLLSKQNEMKKKKTNQIRRNINVETKILTYKLKIRNNNYSKKCRKSSTHINAYTQSPVPAIHLYLLDRLELNADMANRTATTTRHKRKMWQNEHAEKGCMCESVS